MSRGNWSVVALICPSSKALTGYFAKAPIGRSSHPTLRRSPTQTQPPVAKDSVSSLTAMPTGRASDATRGSGNQVVDDGNAPTRARRGRQLSPELDDRILEAALAMLADVGYA